MKKILMVLFVLFLGCIPQHSNTLCNNPSAVVSQIENSTVALVYGFGDQSHIFCTGVWVSKDEILTAGHCVTSLAAKESEDSEELVLPSMVKVHYVIKSEAVDWDDEPTGLHLAGVEKIDVDHDLALLRAKGDGIPLHPIIGIAANSPAVGDSIYICGHPMGISWTLTMGNVAAYRDDTPERKGPFMQVAAPVWFGNSGGGSFNQDGELVGIASFMVRMPNNGFFIHVNTIKTFLWG